MTKTKQQNPKRESRSSSAEKERAHLYQEIEQELDELSVAELRTYHKLDLIISLHKYKSYRNKYPIPDLNFHHLIRQIKVFENVYSDQVIASWAMNVLYYAATVAFYVSEKNKIGTAEKLVSLESHLESLRDRLVKSRWIGGSTEEA